MPKKKAKSVSKKQANSLRIIGGQLRGRRVQIIEHEGLRPTSDRVRETVFNWLTPYLSGVRCLDLFAGSGAFGIESVSRGAAFTTFVENSTKVAQGIQASIDELALSAEVIQINALSLLQQKAEQPYDVVFIDPPYQMYDCLAQVFVLLQENGWLHADSLIYFEHDSSQDAPELPPEWTMIKNKKTGQIAFYLCECL